MKTNHYLDDDSLAKKFSISNRRYIGGKSLLVQEIKKSIPSYIEKKVFCDIFAGTGIVGSSMFEDFDSIVFNDFLYSNELIYKGFFGKGSFSNRKLVSFQDEMITQTRSALKENYFSRNFGGRYFSKKSAKSIGFIREAIAENTFGLNKRERDIALASLVYSCDRIANTVGHYEAYRKTNFVFKEFEYRLIDPRVSTNALIYREDSNLLARKIESNVCYVDPPYNSRQYSRFYHLLETLVKWEKPKLEGVALKPPTENVSSYSTTNATSSLSDLVSSIKSDLIIVSYNNTYDSKSSSSKNKIEFDALRVIMMSKGRTKVKQISYKHFSAGNTSFADHKEFLFVTEVR